MEISIRHARPNDAQFVYETRFDKQSRKYSINSNKIAPSETPSIISSPFEFLDKRSEIPETKKHKTYAVWAKTKTTGGGICPPPLSNTGLHGW